MLLNETALKQRIDGIYRSMKTRASKSIGKGKRSIPGISELPFTKEQLWKHALNQVGESGIPCPYCVEIGRPFYFIDLGNLVFDHQDPLWRSGRWDLDNLQACCEDCNKCKGRLTYPTFIAIMQFINDCADTYDQSILYSNMRSHGLANRLRGFYGKKSAALPQPQSDVLNLDSF